MDWSTHSAVAAAQDEACRVIGRIRVTMTRMTHSGQDEACRVLGRALLERLHGRATGAVSPDTFAEVRVGGP